VIIVNVIHSAKQCKDGFSWGWIAV
jgi:hypothetical protein